MIAWARMMRRHYFAVVLVSLFGVQAQERLVPQTDTFNSNYSLTSAQIKGANLSSIHANNFNVALNFERSNWAFGSAAVSGVKHDAFYTSFPKNASSSSLKPGSFLKIEEFTNTSYYTVPPTLAMSRFMYVTEDFNGTAIPASAYVLWPYMPLNYTSSTVPTLAWAHGTSGVFAECGPSHLRNLWYQFSATYMLAISGYAVVATDYAGMGVSKTAEGKNITAQYLAFPAHANDLIYATQAAQAAFSQLSRNFVVMGHSQGGGVAWAAAERQAVKPVPGYLGTIAGSPVTNVTKMIEVFGQSKENSRLWSMVRGILTIFPALRLEDFLTDLGIKRLNLAAEVQACNAAVSELFSKTDKIVKDDWASLPYTQLYQSLTGVGGKKIGGSMLVLQGDADPTVPEAATNQAINQTCDKYPDSEIEYWQFSGVSHTPVLYASQTLWLSRLSDLFAGKVGGKTGCTMKKFGSHTPQPIAQYQKEINYFLEWATADYETS